MSFFPTPEQALSLQLYTDFIEKGYSTLAKDTFSCLGNYRVGEMIQVPLDGNKFGSANHPEIFVVRKMLQQSGWNRNSFITKFCLIIHKKADKVTNNKHNSIIDISEYNNFNNSSLLFVTKLKRPVYE